MGTRAAPTPVTLQAPAWLPLAFTGDFHTFSSPSVPSPSTVGPSCGLTQVL